MFIINMLFFCLFPTKNPGKNSPGLKVMTTVMGRGEKSALVHNMLKTLNFVPTALHFLNEGIKKCVCLFL